MPLAPVTNLIAVGDPTLTAPILDDPTRVSDSTGRPECRTWVVRETGPRSVACTLGCEGTRQ